MLRISLCEYREVEELGLDNQHVREDLHVAQGQAALAQEKTQIAKKELAEIRNRITQQTTEIGELKGSNKAKPTFVEFGSPVCSCLKGC